MERTFALNHLGPFLLTNLLLDRLKAGTPARVVTVSSGAHATGRIDFDDLQGAAGYSGKRAYSASKLANIMFTYELARRLQGTGVTATVLHPGVVRTNFGTDDPASLINAMLPLMRPFMKTSAQGAATFDLPRLVAERARGDGRLLLEQQAQEVQHIVVRHPPRGRLWQVSADLSA